MSKIGFENDRIVPIGKFDLRSSWTQMPNQVVRHWERKFPVMVTGQADAAMRSYLEAAQRETHRKRAAIARSKADRLRALTVN